MATNSSTSSSASNSSGKYGKGKTKSINFANHKFVVGELYDVLDPLAEVWNPAEIVKVFQNKVLVHFPGWDSVQWDEEIKIDQYQSRFAPPWTHVLRCKCFVQLSSKLPQWPCVVYIRNVIDGGSEGGESYLREYKRMYVIVYGDTNLPHLKPWTWEGGVWMPSSQISPFLKNEEDRTAKGDSFREPIRSNFLLALRQLKKLPEKVRECGTGVET